MLNRTVLRLAAAGLMIASLGCGSSTTSRQAADFTVNAEQLAKESADDPKAVLARYKDKTLRISGKVLEKSKDDRGILILKFVGNESMPVKCGIGSSSASALEKLEVGQQATVFGLWFEGVEDDYVLVNGCEIEP